MAKGPKPIEPTPTLYGKDAQAVLESLRNVAPADELARRRKAARAFAAQVTSDRTVAASNGK